MSERPEVTPIVYTVDEVAILLKLNRTSVYNLHHQGRLTIRKLGDKSVILKSEIDALLANNEMPRNPNATRKARMDRHLAKKAAGPNAAAPDRPTV